MRPTHLAAIDLNLLRIADALFETRSVTVAAAVVHLSQPAVSRALARLREQLDDPLMVREGRSMVLTPFARHLQPRLRNALLELERAVCEREAFEPASAQGAVVIAGADYSSVAFLASALRRLSVEAPGLELVSVRYTEPVEALLESGAADVAIGPRPSERSWIRSTLLFRTGWVCVASARHPPQRRLGLDRYCDREHVLVSPSGQGGGAADGALARLGRERTIRVRVPDFAGALALAAQTELLLTVPERLAVAAAAVFPLTIRRLPFSLPDDVTHMSWHATYDTDPRHAWLRETICAVTKSPVDPGASGG